MELLPDDQYHRIHPIKHRRNVKIDDGMHYTL